MIRLRDIGESWLTGAALAEDFKKENLCCRETNKLQDRKDNPRAARAA